MESFEEILSSYNATYDGLRKWYNRALSHYGLIVLAYSYNHKIKVIDYVINLGSLEVSLQDKISNTYDADKINDLTIMRNNITVLLKVAIDNFGIDLETVREIIDNDRDDIIEAIEKIVGNPV